MAMKIVTINERKYIICIMPIYLMGCAGTRDPHQRCHQFVREHTRFVVRQTRIEIEQRQSIKVAQLMGLECIAWPNDRLYVTR